MTLQKRQLKLYQIVVIMHLYLKKMSYKYYKRVCKEELAVTMRKQLIHFVFQDEFDRGIVLLFFHDLTFHSHWHLVLLHKDHNVINNYSLKQQPLGTALQC